MDVPSTFSATKRILAKVCICAPTMWPCCKDLLKCFLQDMQEGSRYEGRYKAVAGLRYFVELKEVAEWL